MDYKNKSVLLVSKHQKERVIHPVFQEITGCDIHVSDFDTDKFGTFTGEIARTSSAYETCILKAKTVAKVAGYRLGLASEGSFGPHPAMPFLPSDHEIMVFFDQDNNWIIAEQLLTQKTNYNMMTIHADSDFDFFLRKVQFPSHALILQTSDKQTILGKGINDYSTLEQLITAGFKRDRQLILSTDMRAMMNPTRMEILGELAKKLATRITQLCPECNAPGFGFKSTGGYLPCDLCRTNSNLYQHEIWGCISCTFSENKPRQDNKQTADPGFCNYCNP